MLFASQIYQPICPLLLRIFSDCYPFKICPDVAGFIAIDMVDMRALKISGDKRFGDEAMDG